MVKVSATKADDLRKVQRLEIMFEMGRPQAVLPSTPKIPAVTCFIETTIAGLTTFQQVDPRTLRFSSLELRVSDSA